MRELANLMIVDARERMSHQDLPGAWDDIVVLLRMARHVSEGATMTHGRLALAIEKDALDLAIVWATAPGQTPDRLRAAIAAYRDLPRLTPAAEVVRAEAILVDRTIDLPSDDLKGLLLGLIVGPKALSEGKIPVWQALWIDMITTPWERARARRANRRFAAALVQVAPLEPWQPWPSLGPGDPILYDLQSAPLARVLDRHISAHLNAENRNEVARRAIVQVMAIRAWQLKHDGRFPPRLERIVPDELPSLPVDPYSGKPFGYIFKSSFSYTYAQNTYAEEHKMSLESPLLYSVGLDRRDDQGSTVHDQRMPKDIVFRSRCSASRRVADRSLVGCSVSTGPARAYGSVLTEHPTN